MRGSKRVPAFSSRKVLVKNRTERTLPNATCLTPPPKKNNPQILLFIVDYVIILAMMKRTLLLLVLSTLLGLILWDSGQSKPERRGHALGDLMHNIGGKALDEYTYSSDALRGSFVFITFWALDCHICELEMPRYESFYKKVRGKDLKFLSFAINARDVERIRKHANEMGMTFPVIPLSVEETQRIAKEWRIMNTPYNLLLNPEGVIILKNFFGDEGLALVRKITNEKKSFRPPRVDFEPLLSPLRDVIKLKLSFGNLNQGSYDFLVSVEERYVSQSGKLGANLQLIPLKVEIRKNGKKYELSARVLNDGRDGTKARLPSPKNISLISEASGNSGRVEIILPVSGSSTLYVTEGKIYSNELRTYIPIWGGYVGY